MLSGFQTAAEWDCMFSITPAAVTHKQKVIKTTLTAVQLYSGTTLYVNANVSYHDHHNISALV